MSTRQTLFDFDDGPDELEVEAWSPIYHPYEVDTLIGYIGKERQQNKNVALFQREHEEHWFRKLSGYGLSEDILKRIAPRVESVLFAEQGDGAVFEFELSAFIDAPVVVYAPGEDEAVIGDAAELRVDEDKFTDKQRVPPAEEARRVWERGDLTVHE